MKKNIFNFLSIFVVCFVSAQTPTQQEILTRESAPSIFEVGEWANDGLIEKWYGPVSGSDPSFPYILAAMKAMLTVLPEREVFLAARDMDIIYDAFEIVLSSKPEWEPLRKRIHRLEISRRVAETSSGTQLKAWCLKAGLDFDKILSGEQKAITVDIGWRGQIFHNISRRILDNYFHNQQISAQGVVDFVDNMGFKMLGTSGADSLPSLKQRMQRENVESLIHYATSTSFYYPNVWDLDPGVRQATFGNDSLNTIQQKMIRDVKREANNWRGRGLELSPDGSRMVSWDRDNGGDAEVSRDGFLKYNTKLIRFFTSHGTIRSLTDYIENARIAFTRQRSLNPASDSQKLVPADKRDLVINSVWISGDATEYIILEKIHEGSQARVYKLKNSVTGELRCLKVGRTSSNADIRSLDKNRRRLQKLNDLGISTARIIEFGDNYILKEWVEGPTAKDWLKVTAKRSDPNIAQSDAYKALVAFFETLIARHIYIHNLTASNLVWDNDRWKIIDSSSIDSRENGDPSFDAKVLIGESLIDKWQRYNVPLCSGLLRGIGAI